MTSQEDPGSRPDGPEDDGTPSAQEVEHDFTVPDDADLRPVADVEGEG
jgi:hypothetical protein